MATSFNYGQAASAKVSRDQTSAPRSAADSLARFRVERCTAPGRSLTSLIESEIIPRLIVARPTETPTGDASVTAAEVESFAPLALQVEADELIAHAERMLARGVTVETMLVDLLAPAARVLGEYWEADRCNFVDVTMALWRLQEVVHEITARGPAARPGAGAASRALFAAMPGDQHGFGTLVVEEMFARAGWTTDRLGDASLSELYDRVGNEWFDMVGLTVSCDSNTGPLASVIVALRNVSRNPRLVVMVGGRVFVADPALARAVGADGTAGDARLAVEVASQLVAVVAREGLPCE